MSTTFMYLKQTISKSTIWFSIGILIAFISGVGMFFYSSDYYDAKGKVLGVQTSAPPLFKGDVRLVKTPENPSVYAIVGNQKHLIRSEEIFYSYDYNFKNVKVVSPAELNRYKLARLVKERGSSRVYYLSHEKNLRKYHHSLQAFNAYPSNSWGDVIEISSADFNSWEEAVLFKEAGKPTVYFITSDYKKAAVPSEGEFINAGFQWDKIITLYKADVDSYETVDYSINLVRSSQQTRAGQENNSNSGQNQNSNTNTNTSAQLIISLDSSSPKAGLIPFSTTDNIVAVFKAQAVGENVTIESINITKSGILRSEKINSLLIEDENGVEFGRAPSISGNTTNIRFENLIIPRNTTKKLILKAGFNSGTELNHDVSFGIDAEYDIKSNAAISGIFPMHGEKHKLIAASNFVGQVEVESNLINSSARSINIGSKQEQISKFTFIETTGNEKVVITKILLTNNGSASDQAVENITLYKDGRVIKNAGKMQNRTALIDLSDNKIEIENDEPVEITIKADILREENSTLKFVINKATDISAIGLREGYGIIVSSSENFPIGRGSADGYNKVTFTRQDIGFFALSIDDDDLKIYRGQEDAILAKFELRNANEDIYLQRMQIKINKAGGAPDLDENFAIKNENDNSNVITLADEKVAGGAVGDYGLNNYKIGANRTITLTIRINVPEDSTSGNTYQAVVQDLSYKIGLDNMEYSHGTPVSGQTMTVYAPRLTIQAGELENEGTGTAGDDDVELASFNFTETTTDERIKITSLVASLTTASDDLSYVRGFSNLGLYANGRRVSQEISEPSSSTYTFTNLNISISAGGESNIIIKADVADYAEGTIQFKIDAVTAEGYGSKAPVYIMGEGTISDSVTILPPSE